MKLVKGTILSSKPISISKASSILTRFLSTETGAPPAVSTYLKRAATSLEELAQVHRETKTKQARHKHKEHQNDQAGTENPREELDAGKVGHSKQKHKVTNEEHGRDVDLINSAISLGEVGSGYRKDSNGRESDEEMKKRNKKMDRVNQSEVLEKEAGKKYEVADEEHGRDVGLTNSASFGYQENSHGRELDAKTKKRKKEMDHLNRSEAVERDSGKQNKVTDVGHDRDVDLRNSVINSGEMGEKTKKRKKKMDHLNRFEAVERDSGEKSNNVTDEGHDRDVGLRNSAIYSEEMDEKTTKRKKKRDQADRYEVLKGEDGGLIPVERKRKLETGDGFEQIEYQKEKKRRKNKNLE